MYQYFIVSNILTHKHIEKLKKHLHYTIEDDIEILTDDGLYKLKDDTIYKFNISNSIKPIKFQLLNLNIIQQHQLFHKINKNIQIKSILGDINNFDYIKSIHEVMNKIKSSS